MRKFIALIFSLLLAVSVSASFTETELLAEAEGLPVGQSRLIIDGENVIFLYRAVLADIDIVNLCCALQSPLRLIDRQTNLWATSINIPKLNEALITYAFQERKNHRNLLSTTPQTWRGEDAPPSPPQSQSLSGMVMESRFESQALGETRSLTIYFPPDYDKSRTYPVIYATNGQAIAGYLPYLDQLIVSGEIPPVLLIAAHSVNHMADYIWGASLQFFDLHKEFFVEELRLWAEANLGASTLREERAVFGAGTAGVFTTIVAVLHSDIYGIAFPFSIAMDETYQYARQEIDPNQRLYFTSGTIAAEHTQVTVAVYERFSEAGAQVVYHERVAGFDATVWQEEFYYAVKWAFGE